MLDESMLHSMYELVANMWVHADPAQTQGQYAKGILVVIGQRSLTDCKFRKKTKKKRVML